MVLLLALLSLLLLTSPAHAGRTFGGVSTDKVATANYAAINNLTTMTICAWTYRTGDGGGSLGRIVDKNNANANGAFMLYTTTTNYNFETNRWQTTQGGWHVARPSANTWVHVCVIYDYGLSTNVPIFYFDGTSPGAAVQDSLPSGTTTTETETMNIGNRNDNARNWAGRIAEVYIWNVILTQTEITALANRACGMEIRPASLVFAEPLRGVYSPEPNLPGVAQGTVTGTVISPHPHTCLPIVPLMSP